MHKESASQIHGLLNHHCCWVMCLALDFLVEMLVGDSVLNMTSLILQVFLGSAFVTPKVSAFWSHVASILFRSRFFHSTISLPHILDPAVTINSHFVLVISQNSWLETSWNLGHSVPHLHFHSILGHDNLLWTSSAPRPEPGFPCQAPRRVRCKSGRSSLMWKASSWVVSAKGQLCPLMTMLQMLRRVKAMDDGCAFLFGTSP